MLAMNGKRKQLTTQESNDYRFVTRIRWIVEVAHGWVAQKCKLLHHQFRNQLLPEAAAYYRIACLLYNLKGKRLNILDDEAEAIIHLMKTLKMKPNLLAEKVKINNYDQKSAPFRKITSNDLLDFPELTMKDLTIFFTGTYQVSQAISYFGVMLDDEGNL